MAHEATAWALIQMTGSASAKLVLVALADRAKAGSGWTCWPSVADLRSTTELDRKTVIAALAALEGLGLIHDTGERKGITRQVRVYRVNIEQSQKRNSSESGTVPDLPRNSPVIPSKQSQKRDTEPVIEPVKEPREPPPTPQGVGDDFAGFWQTYPRKVSKEAAMKAWARVHPPLVAVLNALAWQCQSEDWIKDGGRFIPHPATYINGRRWEDEPAPPRPVSSTSTLRQSRERKWAALYGNDAPQPQGHVIDGECAIVPEAIHHGHHSPNT